MSTGLLCPICKGTGFYGDLGAGKKGNNEYIHCECLNATSERPALIPQDERKIYELSVKEFKKLWIECYEEMEQHKLDTAMKTYKEIFTRNGEAVPQEY